MTPRDPGPHGGTRTRTGRMSVVATAAAALVLTACGGSSSSAAVTPAAPVVVTSAVAPASAVAVADPGGGRSATVSCGRATTRAGTASQLRQALALARPGAVIVLAAGKYAGHFATTASGTAAKPVTLCGPRTAVLDGGPLSSGYTFYLDHASWWRVEGFTVQGGQKGVVADGAVHDLIDRLYVHDTGAEGIHLRAFSSHDTVSHDTVRGTGRSSGFYGEGIYVGSANRNWCQYTGCKPDGSDYDTIAGNDIFQTTAENIDIKEGTAHGTVSGNHFNGAGMKPSAATSWVNVKGNDWKITGNTGTGSNQNGLSDHQVYKGWGLDNVFTANVLAVNGPGYGIYIQSKRLADIVACDNKVTGARAVLSDIGCTSAR